MKEFLRHSELPILSLIAHFAESVHLNRSFRALRVGGRVATDA